MTKLQKLISQIAPSIHIKTTWEQDSDAEYPINNDDAEDKPENFQAWQSEITTEAIVDGELTSGSEYMGGTWEKTSDFPWISNPTVSGYEHQMTIAALETLQRNVTFINPSTPLLTEIKNTISWLNNHDENGTELID